MAATETLGRIVESPRAQKAIAGLIVLNAGILGLETEPAIMAAYGSILKTLDRIILGVFVLEIAAKLVHRRAGFFRDGWNCFDFLVVAISLIPASGPLAVLRVLRILRVLRLVSVVPSMRKVVEALLRALPGMGSVAALILMIFYVGAVLATNLFGADFPQWFGSIGESMYSLFQIMTLESWSMGIVRPVMEVHPLAWGFFVPFILITSFAVLNLFIGIIVDAMQKETEAAHAVETAQAHDERTVIRSEIETVRRELVQMNQELARLRQTLTVERAEHRGE